MGLGHIVFSTIIVFIMMLFYRQMPYLIMFGLFAFIGPVQLLLSFPTLRWAIYFGFALFGILFGRRRTTMQKLIMPDLILIAFIIAAVISYPGSIRPNLTIQRGISVILMYFAVFVGLYTYVDSMDRAYKVLRFLLAGVVIYNLLSFMPGIFKFGPYGRLRGLSNYPGVTGAINAFMMPAALAVYLISRKKIHLLCVFLILLTTYLSYARAAFICLVLGGLLFYAQYFRNKKAMFVLISLLALGTALVSFYLFGIWLPGKLVRLPTLPLLGGRLGIWKVAREMISRRPWLGFGFGTEDLLTRHFGYKFGTYHYIGGFIHSSFYGLALQIGIPMTVAFFAMIFHFTLSSIRFTTAVEEKSADRIIGIALSTMLFVGLLYCFSESWIYSMGNNTAYSYYIVVMLMIRFKKFIAQKMFLTKET